VTDVDYTYPENFPGIAKDLVDKLLVVNPDERLGGLPSPACTVGTWLRSSWSTIQFSSVEIMQGYVGVCHATM